MLASHHPHTKSVQRGGVHHAQPLPKPGVNLHQLLTAQTPGLCTSAKKYIKINNHFYLNSLSIICYLLMFIYSRTAIAREANCDKNRINLAIKESEMDPSILANSAAEAAKNFIAARISCRIPNLNQHLRLKIKRPQFNANDMLPYFHASKHHQQYITKFLQR